MLEQNSGKLKPCETPQTKLDLRTDSVVFNLTTKQEWTTISR